MEKMREIESRRGSINVNRSAVDHCFLEPFGPMCQKTFICLRGKFLFVSLFPKRLQPCIFEACQRVAQVFPHDETSILSYWACLCTMVLVTESRRVNSLHFKQERRVIHLHDKGMTIHCAHDKFKSLMWKRLLILDANLGGETCPELRTTQMKVPDALQDPLAPLDS